MAPGLAPISVVAVLGIRLAACDRPPTHEPMMAQIGRRVRPLVLVLASLVLLLTGAASASASKPHPSVPTPAYSPPPSEPSPFSGPDQFCVRSADRFDTVDPTAPQLRAQPAEVVWLAAPDSTTGAADEARDVETFTRLIDRCGGIGGRRLDLDVLRETGDPRADCLTAVTRFHPVMVVSISTPPAGSCIVRDERTILVTKSDASNADLTGAGGRFVAAGSSEGVQQARLLGLVHSGRLADRKVAIVAGDDPTGGQFLQAARTALATDDVKPVELANADSVLVPTLDLANVPLLVRSTQAARHGRPLDVYAIDAATATVAASLEQLAPGAAATLLRSANLYAFSPTDDPRYRASLAPNAFSEMCNRAVAAAVTTKADPTTTSAPQPPVSPSYLTTADVCLLTRIVARGLFSAGATLDQRAVITALHRLPYVDQAVPGGTPKPRPNEVVNEPVRRIEQVVALMQLRSSCPSETKTTPHASARACWFPASSWDDGGMVVNVPLATTPSVSH